MINLFANKEKKYSSRYEMYKVISTFIFTIVLLVEHIYFAVYFMFCGIDRMFHVVIVSIIMNIISLCLFKYKKSIISAFINTLEISFFCIGSITYIGVSSNIQYYLIIGVLAVFLVYYVNKYLITIHLVVLFVVSLIILYISENNYPLLNIDDTQIRMMTFYNLFFAAVVSSIIDYISDKYTDILNNEQIDKLSKEANIDKLTNLWNRRYAEMLFKDVLYQKHENGSLAFAIMDIDFFKKVNDQYGHNNGDLVLVSFANSIKSFFRENDYEIRWGGEEFLVLINASNVDKVRSRLIDFLKKIEETKIIINDNQNNEIEIYVTITIGFSMFDTAVDIEKNISRADEALYYGKNNGRNQVVYYYDIPN